MCLAADRNRNSLLDPAACALDKIAGILYRTVVEIKMKGHRLGQMEIMIMLIWSC